MSDRHDIAAVWSNGRIPVVAVPLSGKVKIRIPYSSANRAWIQIGRSNPEWNKRGKHWSVPRAWLNRIARHAVESFGQCYVIQSYRETEKCAPACWNATGVECSCSCLGENHGQDDDGSWYVVSDVFACRSGGKQYAVRLLSARRATTPTDTDLARASGIKWNTYFARVSGSSLVKIGKSTDVQSRIKGLQTGCPGHLKLIGVIHGDHEAGWHERFSDNRISGEWFRLDDSDVRSIETAIVLAGGFVP